MICAVAPVEASPFLVPITRNVFAVRPAGTVTLTVEEQQEFTAYLMSKSVEKCKYKNVFLLQMYCGLRIGEICALRWNDIDLEQRVIHIRSTVARVKNNITGGTHLIIDKPKTEASLRNVPIHSKLLSIITEMKSRSTSLYIISNSARFAYFFALLKYSSMPFSFIS